MGQTAKQQAGKRQNRATKQVHEAARKQPRRQAKAGRRAKTEPRRQMQARHGTKTSQPTNYRQASGKTEPRSRYKHETARNQPKRKAQAGKRQEETTKQIQAPNRRNGAKTKSTEKKPPKTNHEADTSTKPQKRSQNEKYREKTVKNFRLSLRLSSNLSDSLSDSLSHSGLTAAQRDRTVQAFCSCGGTRMNLVQIFRALAPGAAGSQLLRKLPPLALQLLLDYCVEPRVLMADSTADVGIADLHRTLECVVATRPAWRLHSSSSWWAVCPDWRWTSKTAGPWL